MYQERGVQSKENYLSLGLPDSEVHSEPRRQHECLCAVSHSEWVWHRATDDA